MAMRTVVWGCGLAYLRIASTLSRLAEKGQIELVAFTARSLPKCGFIDGVPIVACDEVGGLDFDLLIACSETEFDDVVRDACENLGVPQEKVIPSRIFELPNIDLDDYMELKRSSVSIISDLCWGGLTYKLLGLPCLSPFRNLFIWDSDYLRLLVDLKHYCVEGELEYLEQRTDDSGEEYPVMLLGGDVKLHFNHVKTPEEAVEQWERRRNRINWDNLFLEMHTENPCIERDFDRLAKDVKHVCFVSYESALSHSVFMPSAGSSEPLYDWVNGTVMRHSKAFLLNPIPLLLGRDDFRRYSLWNSEERKSMAPRETPKTSVVIPVYNTKEYLPACLDSVLAQTQQDIEIILIDDGSTDGSLDIENAYAARDPRVRVFQQPNLRQGTARNRGLAEARGEYVYFMDSDDIIVPEHFETCYRICKWSNLDFVTFDSAGFVDDPDVERPDLFQEMCDRSADVTSELMDGPTFWGKYFNKGMTPFLCWLEYFDRSFLLENDLRFAEGIYFEDNDWIGRVYMAARRMQYVPLKLHRYRERPGSNVHAGFTPVLADSCFDVHRILCELACRQSDAGKLRVLQDVSTVKDIRFRQFAELEPSEELRARVLASAEEMRTGCLDVALPYEVRIMHLMALLSLAKGVRAWPDTPLSVSRDLVVSTLFGAFPNQREAPRLGIYGTGKICQAFLGVLDCTQRTCIFFETQAAPGQTFKGEPVYSIDEAVRLNLDALVIASTKYAGEMREKAQRVLGDSMALFAVPRAVLTIEDLRLAEGL